MSTTYPHRKTSEGEVINMRSLASNILISLDNLEKVVYNQDIDDNERGTLVQEQLNVVKDLVKIVATVEEE